ncbi:MAG: Eco57I restriction-modification methylase domain-containing protein [Promethearchaeota archaeon]
MKTNIAFNNIEIKKRKEEGVFYTPEFITDFMCKNSIIPYLSKKGAENINELISEYYEDIEKLESKLRNIKILDPACGCGAFLIKAFDVLLEITKEIRLVKDFRGMRKKDQKAGDMDIWINEEEGKQIIENNLYGVDINESLVKITKLGLLSRITKKDRKLMDLSQNIICGDSLLEDASLKSDKAFKWSYFEEILNKGGFDIIIGNPPYINIIEDLESRKYYKERFPEIYTGKNDIYYYFIRKAIELTKKNGYISLISPRYLMEAFNARKLREYILKETAIQKIIDFLDFKIFAEANVDTAIYILKRTNTKKEIMVHKLVKQMTPPLKLEPPFFKNFCVEQNQLTGKKWYFIDPEIQSILDKIDTKSTGRLKDYSILSKGVQTGKDSVFVLTKDEIEKYSIEKNILRNWVKNSQIRRFGYIDPQLYIIISNRKTIKKLSSHPNLEKYLLKYKEELMNRTRVNKWFHWRKGDERFTIDWNKPKIVTPYKSANNKFTIDDKGCYFSQDIVLILPTDGIDIRYLLSYLNSRICEFYFKIKGKRLGAVYEYYPRQIEDLPFIKIKTKEQKAFVKIVERLLELNKLLSENYFKIKNRIMSAFNIENLNKNFLKFNEKNMIKFFNEKLEESKLSSIQKNEIKEYILNRFNEINSLEEEISQVEEELNHLIYELYDLNQEEIRLIEKTF